MNTLPPMPLAVFVTGMMYPRTLFLWCQTHGVSYYSEALARESQSGMYIIVGNHTIWEAVVWK